MIITLFIILGKTSWNHHKVVTLNTEKRDYKKLCHNFHEEPLLEGKKIQEGSGLGSVQFCLSSLGKGYFKGG